jgi:TonB family protein
MEEATRGGDVTPRRYALAALLAVALGCRREQAPPGQAVDGGQPGGPPDQEPPVALNGDSPIQYPPRLYDQKVEGDVVLRLFVDSTGRLAPESSKVAETSGYTALDSAALAGAKQLHFAPARRHGLPVATAFLQPIEFRHPGASGAVVKGGPDTTRPRPTPAPSVAPVPPAARRRARPDTSRPRNDTTSARPDSGAPAH